MSSAASARSFDEHDDHAPTFEAVEPQSEESVPVHEARKALEDPIFRFVITGFVSLFVILAIAAFLSF